MAFYEQPPYSIIANDKWGHVCTCRTLHLDGDITVYVPSLTCGNPGGPAPYTLTCRICGTTATVEAFR